MRGGPINTRRIVMPPPKPQPQHPASQSNHADLHNLMMRNKAQILDKIPKNGQVSLNVSFLLKVNLFAFKLNKVSLMCIH